MSTAPHFEIDMASFWQDPYPSLKSMRAQAPICYVPQLGGTIFALRDDIFTCEKNISIFSSYQPDGLMHKLMGQNLMRKDGPEHASERKAIFPTVSPKTVRDHWHAQFEAQVEEILDQLHDKGEGNLCTDYALQVSAAALNIITGLTNVTYTEMDSWSQAMIDGIANYAGDAEIEAKCRRATAKIDAAIDDMLPVVTSNPNKSLLSVMVEAGLPMDSVRANIRLAISGGQNEPRDVIAGATAALLTHPDQLQKVLSGEVTWKTAFEEYCRWISPIGMTPRRIARDFNYGGVNFTTDDKVFFMFSSANRDETHFPNGDQFDLGRDLTKSITFGAGPHFCAGAWISRALVGEIALPKLFARMKGLALTDEVTFGGWAFRGPLAVNVEWDS